MSTRPSRAAAAKAAEALSKICGTEAEEDFDAEAKPAVAVGGAGVASASVPVTGSKPKSKKRKSEEDEDETYEFSAAASSSAAADDNDDDEEGDVVAEDVDYDEAGKSSGAKRARRASSGPRRKGPFTKASRLALEKRLKALTHDQLSSVIADYFFDPELEDAEEHLKVFEAKLPGVDVEALIQDLHKARRGIDKAQPRYAKGDDFAFKRCKTAVNFFMSTIGNQARSLIAGSAWSDILKWAAGAMDEIDASAHFYVSSYQHDCRAKVQAAIEKAVASKALSAAQLKEAASLTDGLDVNHDDEVELRSMMGFRLPLHFT